MLRYCTLLLLFVFFVIAGIAQDSIPVADSVIVKPVSTEALTHISQAQSAFKKNNPQNAFMHLNAAESLFKKFGDQDGQAKVQQIFGDYYASNFAWQKAQAAYDKALKIASSDNFENKGIISEKLAATYQKQNDIAGAAKYYSAAITQFDKADLNAKSADNYVNLAEIRRRQKKFSDAEFMIMRRALPLYRSAGFTPGRIGCFDVLGHLYHDQKRLSEAKWYYIQANMLSRTLHDTARIAESLINLANVKISIGDYKLALKDLKEAEALAKRKNLLKQHRDVNNAFSKLYSKTGNKYAWSAALAKYSKLDDSMNSIEKQKVLVANNVKPTVLAAKPGKPTVQNDLSDLSRPAWLLPGLLGLVVIGGSAFYLIRKNNG